MMFSAEQVITQARKEIAKEDFRAAVERAKVGIRSRKKHWFPWRVVIVNLNKRSEDGTGKESVV